MVQALIIINYLIYSDITSHVITPWALQNNQNMADGGSVTPSPLFSTLNVYRYGIARERPATKYHGSPRLWPSNKGKE